jgi:hypothetical protein
LDPAGAGGGNSGKGLPERRGLEHKAAWLARNRQMMDLTRRRDVRNSTL